MAELVVPSDLGKSSVSNASEDEGPLPSELNNGEKHTYGQILKSSALIGGSSLLSVAINIIRTKVLAMLLGPAGFGLMALYQSILDLALSIAGMGINSSGVRQIAEAAGSADHQRIAQTASVLRRTAILLGILGALALIVFSEKVSALTFGAEKYASAVALLALAVFFRLVADSQGALIQGMRRIADLARIGVFGAVLGAIISIALVYALGETGVAPSLVGVAASGLVISWWYSRRVQIESAELTRVQFRQEAASLLKLGFAFMGSGFLMMGAAYVVRMIVLRNVGVEAAGLYQSAWALGGFYVGIILQAMGADFYPRLVGAANNNSECNRLVNEQARVGLLLAGPGVIATLVFAPLVIALFYTAKFAEAVEVLRWICLGIAMRVITWPMGFIIVAKNRQAVFFGAELAWTIGNVSLTWFCVKWFGLNGAGIAFFGSYVFHGFLIYPIVRWLSGFRWSAENARTGMIFISSISIVFCGFYIVPNTLATSLGAMVMLLSGIYSIRSLAKLVSPNRIPRPILQMLLRLRVVSSSFEGS